MCTLHVVHLMYFEEANKEKITMSSLIYCIPGCAIGENQETFFLHSSLTLVLPAAVGIQCVVKCTGTVK